MTFPKNLLPKDMSLRLIDDAGRQVWVTRYEKDRWGNPVTLPESTVNAYLAVGAIPPASELERIIGNTHLGTLVLRTLDFLLGVGEDESFERQTKVTGQYLAQLKDQVAAIDSQFLVLLIPQASDVESPGETYQTARKLLEELKIPYIKAGDVLVTADYTGHWSTEGHQKVGAYLSECVIAFFDSGDLSNCENVVMP